MTERQSGCHGGATLTENGPHDTPSSGPARKVLGNMTAGMAAALSVRSVNG